MGFACLGSEEANADAGQSGAQIRLYGLPWLGLPDLGAVRTIGPIHQHDGLVVRLKLPAFTTSRCPGGRFVPGPTLALLRTRNAQPSATVEEEQ
jgi:hypothetical protein